MMILKKLEEWTWQMQKLVILLIVTVLLLKTGCLNSPTVIQPVETNVDKKVQVEKSYKFNRIPV